MNAVIFLLWACGAKPATPPQPPPAPAAVEPKARIPLGTDGRIVAVGDLHGTLENALAVLRLAGVVDAAGHWSGGTTVLVQTGDMVDRGDDSKRILDLFRALGPEAQAAGGRVVNVIGNHEVLNLRGHWESVSRGDILAFGGKAAREAALAPTGEYGAWIRALPVMALVGDTLFTHGGVSAEMAQSGVDALIAAGAAELGGAEGPVLGRDGPTWYRGYTQENARVDCTTVTGSTLPALGARRMVMGHTIQEDGRVMARCDGALLGIDLGIGAFAGSHLGALEIVGGDARALYPTGAVDLPDPR